MCNRKARRTKKTLLKCEIVRVKVGGLRTEHELAGELQTLEPVDPRQQLAPVFWRACSIMTMAIRELLFRHLDISQT